MARKKYFYLTTTLPYVNAEPHLGFALEIVQADAIARYKRLGGYDVFFNFGTDEHGLKIYRKALEIGKDPQTFVDEYAARFDDLKKTLNLSYNNFIRTTDKHHIKAAQKFWLLSKKNGDIYKKRYKTKYCIGCELEKTDSELINNRCPIHPNQKLEIIEEENYFFRFSKYQDKLLALYKNRPDFVIPKFRLNEIKAFVKAGLKDFSISRLRSKLPWGVPVPDDPDHVMYVWFDALINYISAIGWPENKKEFNKWWPVVQVAGKDNLRQQSAIWQAMLASVGITNSQQIFIHGFISINDQKISKSLGNIISPYDLVPKYGTDAVRYYLLAKIHPYKDSDFTLEKFETAYHADLANGLGNLVARIARLCEKSGASFAKTETSLKDKVKRALNKFRFDQALEAIWADIRKLDRLIEKTRPWESKGVQLEKNLATLVPAVRNIAHNLKPFLPETAEKIEGQFKGPRIKSQKPLFPRLR
jgi:methionyl-tRNA synthetase